MKTKTHKKLNITLPLDVYEWAVKRQQQEQRKTRLGKVHLSNILADAVAEMMQREQNERLLLSENPTTPQPHPGGEIVKPHKRSAGGSKTPKTVTYRKAGRGRK